MKEPSLEKRAEVGDVVVLMAMRIFEDCGAAEDFCVQAVGDVVVFGGVNRLIFSAKDGWHPDSIYCSERFLKKWNERIKLCQ